MEELLSETNDRLRQVHAALNATYAQQRVEALQSVDSLPDKALASIASETIDLMDGIQRMLQPPSLTLAESFLAYIDTKCLWTVVRHEIPDKVSAGHHQLGELAALVGLEPARLRRVMRFLCNKGIFRLDAEKDEVTHSPASTLLTRSHWTQWHNWVDLYGNEFYDFFRSLPAACKAGETRSAAQIELDTELTLYEHFGQHEDLAKKFHRTLGGGATAMIAGILADYDWNSACAAGAAVLDLGGGGGDFLAALLRAYPAISGALFELGHTAEIAKANFRGAGAKFADVSSRLVDFHVGDFTKEVPGYQIYVMKWCLHNWDDEMAVKIMSNVRRAIVQTTASRLLVLEAVLVDGRSGLITRLADMTMMASVNGFERTRREWESLAARSGWRIEGVWPLRNAWCCVIDLRPVT